MAAVASKTFELARGRAVGELAVLGVGPDTWWVAAPIYDQDGWRCRRFLVRASGYEPLPDVPVRGAFMDSLCLEAGHDGAVYLGLAVGNERGSSVQAFRCTENAAEQVLSSPSHLSAYRPSLAVAGERLIVAYDAWDGEAHHIYAQHAEDVARLSRPPGRHIRADVAWHEESGVGVCWVRTSDVMNPEGVVDARCEIILSLIEFDPSGGRAAIVARALGPADDMSHGLLDTSPCPRCVWGYLGQRRSPMLLPTPDGMLLLWEQKRAHSGATGENVGVLWSRRLSASRFGEPVPIATGGMGYTLPASQVAEEDCLTICCMEGWSPDDRRIAFRRVPLRPIKEERLPRDEWRGWQPVTLPLPETRFGGRPTMEAEGKTYRLYWMDPHCHTVLSADAEGEVDELYRYARYQARLDAVVMTDNDYYRLPMNAYEWRHACWAAEAFSEPGEFVAFAGYEWTSQEEGELCAGHRSVILPRPTEDIVRWSEASPDGEALYDFVERKGGLLHAHHLRWRLRKHPAEANIEATSSWQAYLEEDPSCFHEHLLGGHRIGLVGGSDSHRRNPGMGGALTGVWAESLTREGILEALRRHRCYATNGHRVMLDFRVNGSPMGAVVRAQSVLLTVKIIAPIPIVAVQVIRDGKLAREWDSQGRTEFSGSLQEEPPPGGHFYYVKALLEGHIHSGEEMPGNLMPAFGARAWSSPIWLES